MPHGGFERFHLQMKNSVFIHVAFQTSLANSRESGTEAHESPHDIPPLACEPAEDAEIRGPVFASVASCFCRPA